MGLYVNGALNNDQVMPFEALAGGQTDVSDPQLVECSLGDCDLTLQYQNSPRLLELNYGDLTITQINSGT